ncbi:MAG: C10 family peptidase, partial [Thermoplasmatales archaeon]
DEDKAALTFACGVAAKQVYSATVSGTFGVDQAYDAYKRFSFDDCVLLTDDDPEVYEQVQDNIINGLPVHLAVVTEAWDSGHNLVIDGYNDDGYYHLNFGWGGSYDGWYKIPEELPYELTVLEGVIVDIINDNSNSYLHGEGVLYWPNTNPGTTVEGSFTIENVGTPGSSIDWEIIVWPDWGEWSFDPSSGTDLTPEGGPQTIDVSVIVPDKNNKHFNGYVKIVDVDNSANSCLIHISLTTPRSKVIFSLFDLIYQRYINSFPLLRFLFGL